MTEARAAADRGKPLRTALYAAVFCFTASEAALHLLVPVFLTAVLDVGPALVGLNMAVFGLAALASRLPVGILYRRERAAAIVLTGGAVATASYALVPIFAHPLATTALLAVDGSAWAATTTVLLAALADDHDPRHSTSRAMGWYMGFIGLGNAAAGLAGILADAISVQSAFLVLAAIPALATVAAAWTLRRTAPAAIESVSGSERLSWRGLVIAARSVPAGVWAAAVVMVHINAVNGLVNALHPVLGLRAGLSISEIGILSSVRSLASSSTRIGTAPLAGWLPWARMTTPLLIVGSLAIAIIPVVAWSFWLQVPLFVVAGVSRGFLRVSASAMALDEARERQLSSGVTSALIHAGLDVGRLAGPLLGGIAAAILGLSGAFVFVPILFAGIYAMTRLPPARPARGSVAP